MLQLRGWIQNFLVKLGLCVGRGEIPRRNIPNFSQTLHLLQNADAAEGGYTYTVARFCSNPAELINF